MACMCVKVQRVRREARLVDKIIMTAFENYCGWPEMVDVGVAERYAMARRVVRGALREGGFGLTAVEDISLPAFYHAAAHSLRWICSHPSIVNILRWDLTQPPRDICNAFVAEYLDAEEELLTRGCTRPGDTSIRPTGATALLPTWKDLIFPLA